jgi:serine/threonine protein phosphatase PrpC
VKTFYDTFGTKLTEGTKIEEAQSGNQDYQYSLSHCVGGATLQGRRDYQEDRMIAQELDQLYCRLTDKHRQEVLASCFKSLNKNIQDKKCGSTCVVLIIDADRQNFIIANLGDSKIRKAIINPQGNYLYDPKIQHKVHIPSRESEARRIRHAGGTVAHNRLYDKKHSGNLGVSRAFGDKKYEPGIGHQPDIECIPFVSGEKDLTPESQIMFIVASDGLDRALYTDSLIETTPGEFSFKPAHQIALNLCNNSYNREIKDNITSQVALVPTKSEPDSKPILIAVFDGHGGKEVSEKLRKTFMEHFNNALNRINKPTTNADMTQNNYTSVLFSNPFASLTSKKQVESTTVNANNKVRKE